jgi:DMSO/TMAO reductase YedYZ molybdopterin-dependent catalytic subunit
VPGWYATDSVKWLVRIELIEGEYDGPFEALDYRLGDDRLTELPVHALVTSSAEGAQVAPGPLDVGGVAWGGRGGRAAVEVRIDGGDWDAAACDPPPGPYALTRWRARVELTPAGGRSPSARPTVPAAASPRLRFGTRAATRTRASTASASG